jgi:hypothetical protein
LEKNPQKTPAGFTTTAHILLFFKHRSCNFATQNSPDPTGGQPTPLPNDPIRPSSSSDLPKLILYKKSNSANALGQALAGYNRQVFFVQNSFLEREGISAEVARQGWAVRRPLEARANDSEKTILQIDCPEDKPAYSDYFYYECQGVEVEKLLIDLSSIRVGNYLGPNSADAFILKTILLRAVAHITVLIECDPITDKTDAMKSKDTYKSLAEWMRGYCTVEDLRKQ